MGHTTQKRGRVKPPSHPKYTTVGGTGQGKSDLVPEAFGSAPPPHRICGAEVRPIPIAPPLDERGKEAACVGVGPVPKRGYHFGPIVGVNGVQKLDVQVLVVPGTQGATQEKEG